MKQKDQICASYESVIIKNFRDLTAVNKKQASMVFSDHGDDSITGLKKLQEKPNQTEESLRTVMYFSCWGLN